MSTSNTSPTPAPATDEFDLDDWIDRSKLPERSATVYGRGDLVAEHQRLDLELRAVQDRAEQESASGDARMGGSATTEASRILERMADLEREFTASRLTFRFRAALPEETASIVDRLGKDATPAAITYEVLAVQCVSPVVPVDRWGKIRDRIGEGQWSLLIEAAETATAGRQVEIPFSLAASAARSTQGSSSS